MSLFLAVLAVIGKILLVILAVVLVIILLVLLVPVRYTAKESAEDGVFSGEGRITWLIHVITVDVSYVKKPDEDNVFEIVFRLFGINVRELKKKLREKKLAKRKAAKKHKIEAIREKDPERYEQLKEEARRRREEREAERAREEEEARLRIEAEREKLRQAKKMRERLVIRTRLQISIAGRILRAAVSTIWRAFWFVIGAIERAAAIPGSVVEHIGKIVSKISELCATISKWVNFWGDPRVKNAVRIVKKHSKIILKHIAPKDFSGYVHFGFGDPSLTGRTLGFLSALSPAFKWKLQLDPDFAEPALDGALFEKGRIRLGTVGYHVLLILLRSDVRYAWRTYKALKEESGEEVFMYEYEDIQETKEAS